MNVANTTTNDSHNKMETIGTSIIYADNTRAALNPATHYKDALPQNNNHENRFREESSDLSEIERSYQPLLLLQRTVVTMSVSMFVMVALRTSGCTVTCERFGNKTTHNTVFGTTNYKTNRKVSFFICARLQ